MNLFKTDFCGAGYYFSRQFDLEMRWINTDNLAEIGADSVESAEGILYRFSKKNTDRVYVNLLLGRPYGEIDKKYKNLRGVRIRDNMGHKKDFTYSNLRIGENILNLSSLFSGRKEFEVVLKDLPEEKAKYKDLVIRRIEVSVLPQAKSFLPIPSLLITAIAAPLILLYFFRALGLKDALSSMYSAACLMVFYLFCYLQYGFFSRFHLFFLFLIYLFYLSAVRLRKIKAGRLPHIFLLVILLTAGIYLRWAEVERVSFAVPHPDAGHPSGLGYRQLADNMKLFTKDGFFAVKEGYAHEPFYQFIAKLFFVFFGSSDLHLRFVSFFFSSLAVWLVYVTAGEFFKNKNIALIAAVFMALNSYLIKQASFGLRLELEICLLLALFYFCFLKKERLRIRLWFILSGTIGGLWLLTRSHQLPVILFIFAYSAFQLKTRKLSKKLALFVLLFLFSVSLLLPYKINSRKVQGDFFSDSTYATGFANYEFAGQAGFPRSKVSLAEYYLKLHTPAQLINYHLIGAIRIFYFLSEQIFNIINEQNHLTKVFFEERFQGLIRYPVLMLKIFFLSLLSIFAVGFSLIKREFRVILYIIIIGVFANLFFYGITRSGGGILIQANRTIAHVIPFVSFSVACAVYQIYQFIHKKFVLRKF